FFSSRRRHTRFSRDWSSDVCSSDLYLDKRQRGFDTSIIMLGADHHGYVRRMMAMCAAFGDTPGENLEILIGQMVNLVKDGQPVQIGRASCRERVEIEAVETAHTEQV